MSDIENIYDDEQEKLDNDAKEQEELMEKIGLLLTEYRYFFSAELKDGLPVVKLLKLS